MKFIYNNLLIANINHKNWLQILIPRLPGLPSDGQQRQAMDILQCLVYTAAEIGAEEFIQMIFSTPAGRIVFEAYKKESSLPEDMAEANGHEDIATFLRAITKRYIFAVS